MNQQQVQIDYLIVGQGLAGTLLAHFLLLANQKVLVVDAPWQGASSAIAAGIINPVTGRRIARSWRFEEFYPFAKETYRQLESLLNVALWQDRHIVRALPTLFDENEWLRRSALPEYETYFGEFAGLGEFEGKVRPVKAWGELRCCAQVDVPLLVKSFRSFLQEKKWLLEQEFQYKDLRQEKGGVGYRSFQARGIVFCEGARATRNPFFNYLPFAPTKGELLIARIPGCRFSKLLKHNLFIVPLPSAEGEDLYWVGSSSRFEFEDESPSPEQRLALERQLSEILTVPFEVIDHRAGIRPAVFDIRPFLGRHPVHPQLFIFNGLGTKGASLAPFFAKQMSDYLLGNTTLDAEVDIKRFACPGEAEA